MGVAAVRRALTPASTALTLSDRRPRADLQEDTVQSSGRRRIRRNGTASASLHWHCSSQFFVSTTFVEANQTVNPVEAGFDRLI
jgi:hypothetical protein